MFILYTIYRNIFTSCLERERKKHFVCCWFFFFKLSVVLESAIHMALEIEDLYYGTDSGRGRRYFGVLTLSPAHFAEVIFSQL